MPRLIQIAAMPENEDEHLVQWAYDDFCRYAALQARRPGPRSPIPGSAVFRPRAEDQRRVLPFCG
jgi:hypothetical protein